MFGGFGGNELTAAGGNPGTRNVSTYLTVLSGNLDGNGVQSYHVVTASHVDSSTVIDGFTITGGDADSGTGGGGLLDTNADLTINNCDFTVNESTYAGAGIYNSNSSPTLTNVTFNGNTNPVSGTTGAGLDDESSSDPTLIDCIFINNSTYYGGGALYNDSGCTAELINCEFIANIAHGAVGEGAGIANFGTLSLINCSFTENTATTSASAGIYNTGTATLVNCILYGDTEPGGEIDNSGGTTTVTFSDVQGGYTGAGNINANPLFVDVAADNLQLQSGSPAINAGNSAAVPSNITTDLAGHPRIQGAAVDMGAYEFASMPLPVLSSFTINDGNAQRSMIDSLTVTFNEPVTLAAGAITLNQVDYVAGTTTPQPFTLSNPSGDLETYVLTFTGPAYRGGSLSNGDYNLTVHSALVTNADGGTLSGGDQTFLFYRLFGDFYGTGTVSFGDLLLLDQDYNAKVGSANYLWYMDPDDSGVIDFASLLFLSQDYKDTVL